MMDTKQHGLKWHRIWTLAMLSGLMLGSGLLSGCAGTPVQSTTDDPPTVGETLSPQREDIVMAGLAQLGVPYRYGRSKPDQGFDCSGLTQYVHAQAGLAIPRVSTAQRAAASAVARTALEPGDLVFFKTGVRQYHVGIMVDDEHFVHASTSKHQVRLSPLSGSYWTERFLGGGTFVAEPRLADQTHSNRDSPFGEL